MSARRCAHSRPRRRWLRSRTSKLRTIDEIAPDVSAGAVLAAVDWPDSKSAVVVVGHQPTLGQVASLLLCGEIQDWSIKKGGLWWLSQRENDGDEQTVLRAVINPDLA